MECAEAAERRAKELDAQVEDLKALPVDPRTSAAANGENEATAEVVEAPPEEEEGAP